MRRLTEWLLLDNTAVTGWVVDDGRLHKVPLCRLNIVWSRGEFVSVFLAVLEKALDTLVLHVVLDRAEHHTLLVRCADLEVLGELGHLGDEGLVDGFVDVDALGGNADLAGVDERTHGDFGSDLFDVDVGEDDGGVVAAAGEEGC